MNSHQARVELWVARRAMRVMNGMRLSLVMPTMLVLAQGSVCD
ncbi:MAG: hypothetical protein ABI475_08785 [Methylophilaceae bacterium]